MLSGRQEKEEMERITGSKLDLEVSELRHTYLLMELKGVDGLKPKKGYRLLISFYNDEIYIPMDYRTKDYLGKFTVFVMINSARYAIKSFSIPISKKGYARGHLFDMVDLLGEYLEE